MVRSPGLEFRQVWSWSEESNFLCHFPKCFALQENRGIRRFMLGALNIWLRSCLFIHSTNIQLPPQHFHLSKRCVKLNMVITKFLIFPENSPTCSLSHISFDGNCIFLVAQAKNLECLGPGCLSVSLTPNPVTSKTCWPYPQNILSVQLLLTSSTAASLIQGTFISCLRHCSGLLIGLLSPPLSPYRLFSI